MHTAPTHSCTALRWARTVAGGARGMGGRATAAGGARDALGSRAPARRRIAGHGRVRGRGGGALSSSAATCRRGAFAGRCALVAERDARRKRSVLDQVFVHVVARHWPMKIVANRP